MPYVIRKDGDGWVVKKRFGGKVVGRTDSKEKAEAMVRAIYAHEGA
jgi:hypothetical protein